MITMEFLITCLVLVLIPGSGVLYTVATSLARGPRSSVVAAFGCTLGILPHLAATVLGLAAILHTSAVVFQVLKLVGAAYLLYLAVQTWRNRGGFALEESDDGEGSGNLVVRAILLTILNPKLSLFFLAFLPQFVTVGAEQATTQLVVLSAVFMAMTFAVFAGYGFLANLFRRAVMESPRVQSWLRRGFASTFAALGAKLALAER
ncbi:LysE family translocator [Marinobacter xestospongiae]|uniref:LysE family translocator n=1 Tax=Marinobacter xestospongiae TaxID=994319 RepID=A0ABU3VSQ4_9GAMM|nr:LysE family translocator [Marinobacter xestospongiae]MDV2077293.1 LysE family translocator [Marinobacter xestospongiae]